jgi:hypothetical protein
MVSSRMISPVAVSLVVTSVSWMSIRKRVTADSVRVEVAKSASYGFVTGTRDDRNVSYVVIKDASAPSDYQFTIGTASEGLKLTADNRGGVTVSDSEGNFVNTILAPWAKDANGKNIPTGCTTSGNVVTQHVDTKGAAFPVVADPQYGCGVGWCSVCFDKRKRMTLPRAVSPRWAVRPPPVA